MDDITYVKAATRAIPSGSELMAHVGNCRRQIFGGYRRDGRRRHEHRIGDFAGARLPRTG